MADLSILHNTSSIAAVDADWEARQVDRDWLGLSEIGDPCDRVLWYKYNQYPKKPMEGRVLRLFQLGNLIEDQLVVDLKSAGFLLHSQQRQVTFHQGQLTLKGSIDGIIEGLLESDQPHLWECKSASSKRFTELKKKGYEAWDEKYKTQIHVYCYGLRLNRIYVTVYNKDTSELYAERIKLDKQFALEQLQRVFSIIESPDPTERLSNKRDFYLCKWCTFFPYCHDGVQLQSAPKAVNW